jgi:hypothetical protein
MNTRRRSRSTISSVLILVGLAMSTALGCSASSDADTASGAAAVSEEDTALTPAYWNVDADPNSPSPGSEPINVILSLKGNVQLVDVVELGLSRVAPKVNPLMQWKEVVNGTGFDFVTTGGTACISVEKGRIDGTRTMAGTDAQEKSYRLGGCAGVLADGESHARAWESVSRRKCVAGVSDAECKAIQGDDMRRAEATWYLALSQEHVCLVNVNGKMKPWHCILPQGFRGSPLKSIRGDGKAYEAPSGGYDQGRDDFVADLKRLHDVMPEWTVECHDVPRPAGEGLKVPITEDAAAASGVETEDDPRMGTILKRVSWDDHATRCTITAPPRR